MEKSPIMNLLTKVPGGMVIIPILIGCAFNSFCPAVLDIGGVTTGIARGTTTLLGAFFVCMGASLEWKAAPAAIKSGAVVTFTKLIVSIIIGVFVGKYMNDSLLGLTSLAIIAGMSNSNGGLFAALTRAYGDKADRGAIAIVSLNDGPFFTMIALGMSGLANIPIMTLVAAIIPLVIGCILGNVDAKLKSLLGEAGNVVLILLSFSLGCGMNFSQIIAGGLGGILLGLMTVFIGGICTVFMDRITRGTGISGAAISSVAGNAVATPMAVAESDPTILAAAQLATPQVAAAVIVTAILCPLFTAFVNKNFRRHHPVLDAPECEEAILEGNT